MKCCVALEYVIILANVDAIVALKLNSGTFMNTSIVPSEFITV